MLNANIFPHNSTPTRAEKLQVILIRKIFCIVLTLEGGVLHGERRSESMASPLPAACKDILFFPGRPHCFVYLVLDGGTMQHLT